MMIDPPIDKMVEKVGCKYALVCLVSKRARQLLDKDGEILDNSGERAIAQAAHEVYDGKVAAHFEE